MRLALACERMAGRWLYAWALVAVAFGGASLLVPLYVVALGGDAFALGVLFASASLVGVPGSLGFGTLADRTGRQRIFVLGAMASTVVAMLLVPLLADIYQVVVVNALLWLGFAAATPVLTLMVVAGEPPDRWTARITRLNRAQGIGWALGLALGLVVVRGGSAVVDVIVAQRAFFVACAACAAVALGLAVRTLPPDAASDEVTPADLRRRGGRASSRFNVRGAAFPFAPGRFDVRGLHPRRVVTRFTPRLGTYFLALFLVFTGFGVFFAPLPAYLSGAGYGPGEIFGFYLVLNAGAAAFFGRAGALAEAYAIEQVHVAGLAIRGIAFASVAAVGVIVGGSWLGTGAYTLAFLVMGLTWAVIAVTAATLVTRLAPAEIRGEALGVYGALVAVGGGVGGVLGGRLALTGYAVTFGVAGALVLLGATVVVWMAWRSARSPVVDPESA